VLSVGGRVSDSIPLARVAGGLLAVARCVGLPLLVSTVGGLIIAAEIGVAGGLLLGASVLAAGLLLWRARRRRAFAAPTVGAPQ
jgi:hypothetical protein